MIPLKKNFEWRIISISTRPQQGYLVIETDRQAIKRVLRVRVSHGKAILICNMKITSPCLISNKTCLITDLTTIASNITHSMPKWSTEEPTPSVNTANLSISTRSKCNLRISLQSSATILIIFSNMITCLIKPKKKSRGRNKRKKLSIWVRKENKILQISKSWKNGCKAFSLSSSNLMGWLMNGLMM